MHKRIASAQTLLGLGIVARIVAFSTVLPITIDSGHIDIIKYAATFHRPAPMSAGQFGFQPPL